MSPSKESKVFILGAGCSADCGYPLGVGLEPELAEFLKEVPDECPVVTGAVRNTVSLLGSLPRVETLDQLAKHIEDDPGAWQRQRGSCFVDHEDP